MPAQTVIKLRRSTAAQWTSANPVLGAGEPGLETDTNKVKFGDGTTAWNSLAYSVTSDIEVAVKNATAATITKGSVVYISGADGNNPTIALAKADSEMTSSKTLGFVKADIASGATGTVVTEGMLEGLNTDGASAAGDPIWLSPSIAGGVVYGLANKPVAPNHMVFLGYVVRKQSNNGRIYIKVQNGYELEELHNVSITSVTAGEILGYDGSNWVNTRTITANAATTIPLTLRAASSQTARIQKWENSAGSELAYVTATGGIGTNGTLYGAGLSAVGPVLNAGAQQFIITSSVSTRIVNTIRGAAAQTANLLELQDSASTVLTSVSSAGVITAPSFVPTSSTAPTNGVYLSAANTLAFATNSTQRATISSSGLFTIQQNLNVGTGVGSSAASIEVGQGRTADGTALLDLISDTTYTDYGLRISRSGSSGANSQSFIQHRGTGTLNVQTLEAAAISFATTNATRMTLAATGEVAIGASPLSANMMYVNTTTAANKGLVVRGVTSQTGNLQEWQDSSGTILSRVDSSGRFVGDGSQLTGIAAGESISSFLLMGA